MLENSLKYAELYADSLFIYFISRLKWEKDNLVVSNILLLVQEGKLITYLIKGI